MRSEWHLAALSDVCEFFNGLWKGKKPPFVNVGVIRNTNFTRDGALDDTDIVYLDVEARQFEKRRLQRGDIILEKSGGGPQQPVGRVILFDKEEDGFSFSNFTSAIRVRDPQTLDYRFLHKYLHWIYVSGVTEGMQSHSTGIRNLNANAYKAIGVGIPSLAQQRRLVSILNEAFAGITTAKANAEKNIQNARALFESHLRAVFAQGGEGWVERPLGELCDILDSKRRPITKRDRVKGVIPYYGATGVQDYVSGFLFDEPLVLVGEDGAKWGAGENTAFAVAGKCWVNNHAHVLRPHRDKLLDQWLIHFLTISDLTDFVSGLTVPKLNQGSLRSIPVPTPPVAVQREMSERAAALEASTVRLGQMHAEKLAKLEELKQSLLNQAFAGEL